jgi:hypothetical protein
MKRAFIITATALALTLVPGGVQASSCGSCKHHQFAASSSWQDIVLIVSTAFFSAF